MFFAQRYPDRVSSLILINAFTDTTPFYNNAPCFYVMNYLPEFYLKKYVLDSFPTGMMEAGIADAVDFVVDR